MRAWLPTVTVLRLSSAVSSRGSNTIGAGAMTSPSTVARSPLPSPGCASSETLPMALTELVPAISMALVSVIFELPSGIAPPRPTSEASTCAVVSRMLGVRSRSWPARIFTSLPSRLASLRRMVWSASTTASAVA